MLLKVTVIEPDGARQTIEAETGQSVMRAARNAGIDGIVADCGGEMACATCHVFVCSHAEDLPVMSDLEDEMLDFVVVQRKPNSRLSCQLVMSEALDQLVVELPEAQI